MARSLSIPAMTSALAQNSAEVWVTLIQITHPSLASTIRVCDDSSNTVSTVSGSSQTYEAFPIEFILPTDEPDQDPSIKLVVPNVDRRLVAAVRSISGSPVVTMWQVLASSPNVIEYGPVRMKAINVTYDAKSMQMTLGIDSLTGEPIPYSTFSPVLFPAMFRAL